MVDKLQKTRLTVTGATPTSHNALTNIDDAGSGVSKGHVTDGTQTIDGDKTFSGNVTIEKLDLVAETSAKTIYVRTTGNDTTGDGSTGSPYATIQAALNSIKADLNGNSMYIKIGDGVHDLTNGLDLSKFHTNGKFQFISENEIEVQSTSTATSNTHYSITDTSKSWTDNEHSGSYVKVGTNYFAIAGNDSNTLYVKLIATPPIVDYTIVRFGAELISNADYKKLFSAFPHSGTSIEFRKINLTNFEIVTNLSTRFSCDWTTFKYNRPVYGIKTQGMAQTISHSCFLLEEGSMMSSEISGLTNSAFGFINYTYTNSTLLTPSALYCTYYNYGAKRGLFESKGNPRYTTNHDSLYAGCTFINFSTIFNHTSGNSLNAHYNKSFLEYGEFYRNTIVDCDFLGIVSDGMVYRDRDIFITSPNIGWFTEDGTTEIEDYHTNRYNVVDFASTIDGETVSRSIYVRLDGNDETGDGATGTPFATLNHALSTIKSTILGGVTVSLILGDGVHELGTETLGFGRFDSVRGLGKIAINSENESVIDSGTVTSVTNYTDILVTGKTWTANEHAGKFVKSGSNYFPIAGNTVDTLYVANVTYNTISAFDIVEFSATISDSSTDYKAYTFSGLNNNSIRLYLEKLNLLNVNFSSNGYSVHLKNSHIDYTSGTANAISMPDDLIWNCAFVISNPSTTLLSLNVAEVHYSAVILKDLVNSKMAFMVKKFSYSYFNAINNTNDAQTCLFKDFSVDSTGLNSNLSIVGATFRGSKYIADPNFCTSILMAGYDWISGYSLSHIYDCDFFVKVEKGKTVVGKQAFVEAPTIGWMTEDGSTEIKDYYTRDYNVVDFASTIDAEVVSRDIYVRLDGNDDTGDGSTETPFATLNHALSTIKSGISEGATISIYLGDGVYAIDTQPDFNRFHGVGNSAKGTINIQSENVEVVETGTISDFSDLNNLQDTSKSWTVNEHVGKFVRLNSNFVLPIASNTADTLHLASRTLTAPDPAYEIIENKATIEMSGGSYGSFLITDPNTSIHFYFSNLNMINTSIKANTGYIWILNSYIKMDTAIPILDAQLAQIMYSTIHITDDAQSYMVINSIYQSAYILDTSKDYCTFFTQTLKYSYMKSLTNKKELFRFSITVKSVTYSSIELIGNVFDNFSTIVETSLIDSVGHTYPEYITDESSMYINSIIDCDFLMKVRDGSALYARAAFKGTPNIGWCTEDKISEIANYHDSRFHVSEFAPTTNKEILEDTATISASAVDLDCVGKKEVMFSFELTENVTINNPTNVVQGSKVVVVVKQDVTGSRTITWGANYTGTDGTIAQPEITGEKYTMYTFRAVTTTLLSLESITSNF